MVDASRRQQNNQHATDNEDAKEENTLNSQDGLLPIDIVNPDAIEPKARSYTCRICQVCVCHSILT